MRLRQADYDDVDQNVLDVKELVGRLSRIKLYYFYPNYLNGNFDKW